MFQTGEVYLGYGIYEHNTKIGVFYVSACCPSKWQVEGGAIVAPDKGKNIVPSNEYFDSTSPTR